MTERLLITSPFRDAGYELGVYVRTAGANHLFEWCAAFAAMTALELAESRTASADRVEAYVALAMQAPRS
jgi:hypothetical protein